MGVIWLSEAQSSPFLKNKFNISVKAERKDVDYVKLKAEYRTLKKGRYCKGAFISFPRGEWKCGKGSSQKCTRPYRCRRVNRNFNIKTESRRIRKQMAQTGMVKPGRHKIWISRKPKRKSTKNRIAKSLSPKNFSGVQYLGTGPIRGVVAGSSANSDDSIMKKSQLSGKEVREKMAQEEAMNELREESKKRVAAKIAAKGFKKAERVADVRKNEAMDELDEIDDSEYQEALDVADDSTDSDIELDMEEEDAVQMAETDSSNDSNQSESSSGSIFKLLDFSGGYVSVSTSEQSLSTLEVAWTPRVKFGANSTFGLRGHYGIHQFTSPETSEFEEEVFLITDMKLMIYKYIGNFVVEVGAGVQSWARSIEPLSLSTISGTLGYRFESPIMKAVDRFYVHYMQIASEEPSTSVEIGIGISF